MASEVRQFRLVALTPVHIGTGETITPEEYFITGGGQLVRINLAKLLMEWPEQARRRFEQLIEANQLAQARGMLHEAAARPGYELYRVAMGQAAQSELRGADPAQRRAEVHVFLRNLHAGKVVVPGSAIKGAIRTAIVNAGAAWLEPEEKRRVKTQLDDPRARAAAWTVLEELALGYERERTERDPLRMLHVSDGELEAGAARVDRAVVVDREGREIGRGIQLHVERLLSRVDRKEPPGCAIRVGLARGPRGGHARLDWKFLTDACNQFFLNRYREELGHFSFLRGRQWVPEAGKFPAGAILLRVGRFSHFESLSVDELRSGWNQQRGKPIEGMGSSRTLCVLDNGVRAPFGWVLLEPAG